MQQQKEQEGITGKTYFTPGRQRDRRDETTSLHNHTNNSFNYFVSHMTTTTTTTIKPIIIIIDW